GSPWSSASRSRFFSSVEARASGKCRRRGSTCPSSWTPTSSARSSPLVHGLPDELVGGERSSQRRGDLPAASCTGRPSSNSPIPRDTQVPRPWCSGSRSSCSPWPWQVSLGRSRARGQGQSRRTRRRGPRDEHDSVLLLHEQQIVDEHAAAV